MRQDLKMKIILLERVEKLGHIGQLLNVKPGYARNYLLPRKKALRATAANIAYYETRKAQIEADNLKRKDEAQAIAAKMVGVSVLLIRSASEVGHLYGSVRSKDVAQALQSQGYTVDRTQVQILKPIKTLGDHEVRLQLHPEVFVSVKVTVAQSAEEAAARAEAEQEETAEQETQQGEEA